jgi:hypothetical protein
MLDDRVLDRSHIRRGQHPEPAFQAFLVCRHDLIGHRFGLSAIDAHKCLAWIETCPMLLVREGCQGKTRASLGQSA